jgi:hypothetical protein
MAVAAGVLEQMADLHNWTVDVDTAVERWLQRRELLYDGVHVFDRCPVREPAMLYDTALNLSPSGTSPLK